MSNCPEGQGIARAELARIGIALAGLPAPVRAVLLLHARDGLWEAAIASKLGVSCATVRQLLAEARNHTRAAFGLEPVRHTADRGGNNVAACDLAVVEERWITADAIHPALAAVETLPQRRRLAMRLQMQGMTYQEIAAVLGSNREAVRSLLRAARRPLRGLDPVTGHPRASVAPPRKAA